ncbi:hypothetical protein Goklo_024982 [Gossypium klotzschianum]|uniref:Uncharacterized protein n=1 Tax=Gossypium klotzschianum TaxID=34286 RepID=A0A7J8W2Z9_9ROSI|nr:hypothetical protein [Gossypium klotzschianum]
MKGLRSRPINEAQTFTRPIISGHSITRPNESTDTAPNPAVQLTIPTAQPFQMMSGGILALLCILTLICFLFQVLWQVGANGPVNLYFLLCRVDRRCIGQHRTRDRNRGRRGALLFTNFHHHMSFKHRRRW